MFQQVNEEKQSQSTNNYAIALITRNQYKGIHLLHSLLGQNAETISKNTVRTVQKNVWRKFASYSKEQRNVENRSC